MDVHYTYICRYDNVMYRMCASIRYMHLDFLHMHNVILMSFLKR